MVSAQAHELAFESLLDAAPLELVPLFGPGALESVLHACQLVSVHDLQLGQLGCRLASSLGYRLARFLSERGRVRLGDAARLELLEGRLVGGLELPGASVST